jgi:hypothetical protein
MTNDFKDLMSKKTDAQLWSILKSPQGEYQPAAYEAARNEMISRDPSFETAYQGLNLSAIKNGGAPTVSNAGESTKKDESFLSIFWKALQFFFS